jgi:hypothetical protein
MYELRVYYFLFFQVGSLGPYDLGEKLVLEAVAGDGEVYQRRLSLQFRLVVRVGQFRVENQPEVGAVLDLLLPELDGPAYSETMK